MDMLKKLRREIDRNDDVLITVLAQRLALMPDFAEYKMNNNVPIFQEKREQEIMKRLKMKASDIGLSPEFVEEIFLSIFNEAKRLQQEYMNNKID